MPPWAGPSRADDVEVRSRGAPGSPPSLAVSAKSVASAVPHLFRLRLSALGLEDSLSPRSLK